MGTVCRICMLYSHRWGYCRCSSNCCDSMWRISRTPSILSRVLKQERALEVWGEEALGQVVSPLSPEAPQAPEAPEGPQGPEGPEDPEDLRREVQIGPYLSHL